MPPTASLPSFPYTSKRLFVCCDGTWTNALGPQDKPRSNVTRISRSLKSVCSDNTSQIVMYHPGVGTGFSTLDHLLGGAFGQGLAADIREVYNFVCSNYVDGDDIVLIGFSRGAFTARSVADLIASIGLLTTKGMDHFYPVFQDYENMGNERRPLKDFLFPHLTSYAGERGVGKTTWEQTRKTVYRQWLKSKSWTRDTFQDGSTVIRIKAVAVWDTVGSLGIPPAPVIGIHGSSKQWKFTTTQISSKVENAFQALAIDEPRAAFRPALWERLVDNHVTNLKQVWFPGSHTNVGGGCYDQQIANITLAWMCDQLTTIGVEFHQRRLTNIFLDGLKYSAAHPYPYIPSTSVFIPNFIWSTLLALRRPPPQPWAAEPELCRPCLKKQTIDVADCTCEDKHPQGSPQALSAVGPPRSWGLGQTRYPDSWITVAAGTIVRRPGCFMRVDPDTNLETDVPLSNTNERIHSCVRLRLVCQGLGMDDRRVWPCQSLLVDDEKNDRHRPVWRLERAEPAEVEQTIGPQAIWWEEELLKRDVGYHDHCMYRFETGDGQWQWVYEDGAVVKSSVGDRLTPPQKSLPEEPITGYWERYLLLLLSGQTDVWRFAEARSADWVPMNEGTSYGFSRVQKDYI